jgi:prefoldin subunit 1
VIKLPCVQTDGLHRFVAVPTKTVNDRLNTESTALRKDIAELEKKLHYQETTFKNSRDHIEKILQTGAR